MKRFLKCLLALMVLTLVVIGGLVAWFYYVPNRFDDTNETAVVEISKEATGVDIRR